MSGRYLLSALIAGILLAWAAGTALGLSGEALEKRMREITEQLRCPTCQGISVKDSEATFSRQIRDKVRGMLQEGQGEEEIKAYFVARYGQWILRAPKKEGIGLVLWGLPVLGLVAVGGWLAFMLYRGSRRQAAERSAEAAPPIAEADRRRIEQDLRRFDEEY